MKQATIFHIEHFISVRAVRKGMVIWKYHKNSYLFEFIIVS